MNELYFSRLLLSNSARDLHDVHQRIWEGYRPRLGKDADRPFLFRADRVLVDERRRAWKVLVQARCEADWSTMDKRVLIEHEQTGPRSVPAQPGERLRFFLRANATRASLQGHRFDGLPAETLRRTRGLRVAIRDDDALMAWLIVQGEKGGFALHKSPADGLPSVRILRRHRETWNAKGRHAVHEGVDFEGHLVVTNTDLLIRSVASGFGRARAFGFGLLSLATEAST